MEKPHTMRQKSGYDGKIAGLYDLEETIGKGHFAVVKLAKHVYTGEKVAIKVIDKNKLDDISRAHLLQEVVCMKLVQHPNVVRLYEVIDTTSKLYLILELGDGGDMYDYIMKHAGGLEEAKAKRYFKQIVRAINYCHKLHVVHRDLKPENVVFFEKLGIVKLTDFGFSNKFVPGQKLETSCGSLAYSAPEILLGDSYDAPAVDVWSLGVILYMLVCGVAPFQEANDSETLTMIMDCKYKLPPHLSKECCHLIENMLVRDPSVRFKLEDIANHIWLQGDVPSIAAVEPDPSPLVTKDSVSAEEHKSIISYMLEKKVAPKDTILQSLEKNAYNHITATYYLLAERTLRKQQQKQQQALSDRRRAGSRAEGSSSSHHRHTLKPRAQSQSTDDHDGVTSQAHKKSLQDKPNLSPLALSPRATFSNSSPDPNPTQSPLGALMSPLSSSNKLSSSLQSPSQSHPSHTPGGQHRLCRAICDEHLIEEDEDDSVELAERSVRPANLHYNLSNDCILEEYASDDSDSRSSDTCRSPQRSPTKCSSSTGLSLNPRTPGVRPLHTVRSSPQLLKQIHEESEDEGLVISARTSATSPYRSPRRALMSPDGMKKYERRHKRLTHGSRGTSCSSSDASDNDENETRKRKEKLKGHFHRRDSSDQSSDTDGPSGPGAPPPTGGRSYYSGNNSSHEGGNRRDSNDDNKREGSKDKGKNGSSRQAKGLPPNSNKVNGCFTNNISLATSNLSLKSSTSSLTCRGDKYIVQETNTGQKKSLDNLVENLNKENHTRSRVIQVRSKDFSDLMTRFNHSKQQRANHGVSNGEDTPSKYAKKRNKQVKTDINSNGVYTNTMSRNRDHIVDTRVVDQTVSVRTKCCSLV